MRALLVALLVVALVADASAVTRRRRAAVPAATSSVVFSASSSTACSVATDRYFSQGVACTATYANGDIQWTWGNVHITGISCSQSQDTTCDATFTLYNGIAPTALTCQLPATNSTSAPCTSSGSVQMENSYSLNFPAMAVKDSNGICGAFGPTCTLTFTIP